MNRIVKYKVWLVFVAAVVLAACGGGGEVSFSSANIQNPMLTKSETGNDAVTVFDQDDVIYLLADLNNAPDDTSVKAVWTAVDAEGEAPNTLITESELTTGSGRLTFSLTPDGFLPVGDYKVDLYLNGALNQSLAFDIEGDVAAAQAPGKSDEPTENLDGSKTESDDSGTSMVVTTLADVKQATIRIQAQGSFVDPEIGEALNIAGQGSGFIIDESGIAVTNNHVVTGAAFLQVWVGGEDQPRNARVLGVSECADLAVIDIDGEGYPTLAWYDGDIDVGLDIFVAGYPLFGNEEYTLTSGIVSKAQANGETSWASIDGVIEIDAVINGGNSGGPLVNENGQVVAVNYAGRDDTQQYFSISREVAIPIVERMQMGQDVQSIGINGRAVSDGESIFGIWVSSVASGSPADVAGIRGGDILTKMEGLVLGVDGTMSSYCDILRGRNPEDTMSVEILRFGTGEILEGQLNGRELEVVATFGNTQQADGSNSGSGSSGGYVAVTDDTGQLNVSVPANWSQVDGSAWVNSDGENLGIRLVASPDLDGYMSTWTTPGVSFKASSSLGLTSQELIDLVDFSDNCDYDGRENYSDQVYTGFIDYYGNCGGTGSTYVVLTAEPADGAYVILLEIQLGAQPDSEAFQQILDSFIVQ